MAYCIALTSSTLPISSAAIICGAIDLIAIFIPIAFGISFNTSVLIPKSFWEPPLYVAEISPLSSITDIFWPFIFVLPSVNPLLRFLIISLNNVVLPIPGIAIINVL